VSLSSQVAKSGPFLITGLPQTIPVGFVFQQASDLLVLDTGPTSAPHDPALVLTLNSDYTVTGGGYNSATQMQTGSIVVVGTGANAVQTNDYIVIMRNVPINQGTSLSPSEPLTVQLIEEALDKQATLAQQVSEVTGRSLQFENFEFLNPVIGLSARKSNILGFDANGNIAFYAGASSTAVTSITGTANEVIANVATGNVTLSTPQPIGVTSTPTFGSLTLTNGLAGLPGTTAAGAGMIGETVSVSRLRSNSVTMVSTSVVNVTTSPLSIPSSGHWTLYGNLGLVNLSGTTAITNIQFSISTTSATLSSLDSGLLETHTEVLNSGGSGDLGYGFCFPNIVTTAATTYYLVVTASYTGGGSLGAYGHLSCVRQF
jgi:hypothetical protein